MNGRANERTNLPWCRRSYQLLRKYNKLPHNEPTNNCRRCSSGHRRCNRLTSQLTHHHYHHHHTYKHTPWLPSSSSSSSRRYYRPSSSSLPSFHCRRHCHHRHRQCHRHCHHCRRRRRRRLILCVVSEHRTPNTERRTNDGRQTTNDNERTNERTTEQRTNE